MASEHVYVGSEHANRRFTARVTDNHGLECMQASYIDRLVGVKLEMETLMHVLAGLDGRPWILPFYYFSVIGGDLVEQRTPWQRSGIWPCRFILTCLKLSSFLCNVIHGDGICRLRLRCDKPSVTLPVTMWRRGGTD